MKEFKPCRKFLFADIYIVSLPLFVIMLLVIRPQSLISFFILFTITWFYLKFHSTMLGTVWLVSGMRLRIELEGIAFSDDKWNSVHQIMWTDVHQIYTEPGSGFLHCRMKFLVIESYVPFIHFPLSALTIKDEAELMSALDGWEEMARKMRAAAKPPETAIKQPIQ